MATLEPPQDPDYPIYKNYDYVYSWVEILHSYLSYSLMRIAVLVNVLRWSVLYLAMKQYTNTAVDLTGWRIFLHSLFWLTVLAQLTVTTIDDFSPSSDDGGAQVAYDIWNEYAILSVPFVAYCVIFWLLRRRCKFIIKQHELTEVEVKQVNKMLRQAIVFILAILQWQIIRMVNNYFRKTIGVGLGPFPRCLVTALYFVSESLMLVCICESINSAILTAGEANLKKYSIDSLNTESSLFLRETTVNETSAD